MTPQAPSYSVRHVVAHCAGTVATCRTITMPELIGTLITTTRAMHQHASEETWRAIVRDAKSMMETYLQGVDICGGLSTYLYDNLDRPDLVADMMDNAQKAAAPTPAGTALSTFKKGTNSDD